MKITVESTDKIIELRLPTGALNGLGVVEYPSKGMVGLSAVVRELR